MDILNGQMIISKTTRTHLIYQFIILTLFLGIGYNELLPDRKFLIFVAFLPIFCYQLLILSCCMGLMPVPSWMNFLQPDIKKCNTNVDNFENDFESSSWKIPSGTEAQRIASVPEVSEISPFSRRRWEKSVTNLRASPKCIAYPQKSKSWMNLSDSKSTERLSREESLDLLVGLSERKSSSRIERRGDKARKREERATKAKSWKPDVVDFEASNENEFTNYKDLSMKERTVALPSFSCAEAQEESELGKSYSFPFRQKRLETWLEMKETNVAETNRSPGMPYWQTVGYNLAVKYEARRRRRAVSNPTRTDVPNDQLQNFQKSTEIVPESVPVDKPNTKKSAKSASACMNKIKIGFSNLISKKKEEVSESSSVVPNKISKSALLFKLKNKNISGQTKDKDKPIAMPEFPQFLSNDRPLIFYPKYIPFEKGRFENDVKKKMIELADEQR